MIYIIAEAGNNHGGNATVALEMIDAAVDAGADCIKFQTYKTEKLAGIDDKRVLEHLKKSELTMRHHQGLIVHCKDRIDFLSSAFDYDSIHLLTELGLPAIKIPSGQIVKGDYLMNVWSAHFQRVILSTGMCTIEEVEKALLAMSVPGARYNPEFWLLHCTSAYPTPMQDVNLRAMHQLADIPKRAITGRIKDLKIKVGLSDHTLGIEVPIAAAALGAEIIEKHFTLDRSMDGPDQKMSTEPDEFKQMVTAIRNVEKALGDGVKRPMPSEKETMKRRQK